MLSRILGIILCLILCAWGIWSIHAGFNSDQGGPIFGGFIFLIVGLIIISIIVWDGLEQIMNNSSGPALTDCDQERAYRGDHILYDEAEALHWKALNTPDPNLIHPDDAKRKRLDKRV